MQPNKSSTWRRHYSSAVHSLNGCDDRLTRALGRAEMAIFNRLLEIEHFPDHADEKEDLAKAVEGLLLIKTAVLGYPDFQEPPRAA